MRRREFITLLGGAAAAWPLAARAQQSNQARRIGVLSGYLAENDPTGIAYVSAFTRALQQLGWTDGWSFRARVVCFPMERTLKTFGVGQPPMSIEFSTAPNPRTFRSSCRPNFTWR